jgi:hypothetical protein
MRPRCSAPRRPWRTSRRCHHEPCIPPYTFWAWSAGGYYTDVPRTQHDSPDPEDNLILDLAVHADADLIVTNDSDLLQLGRVHGWKGRLIIDPHRFTALADGAARWEGRP